jgi:hypothetical protein
MRIFVALIPLILSACATIETTTPPAAELASFNPDAQAMIVVNASSNIGCADFTLGLNRNNSPTNILARTLNDKGYDTSEPAILIVEPGKYTLNSAICTVPGYYATNFSNVFSWFSDVEIAPGDVVYIGTFRIDAVTVEVKRGAAARVITSIFALDFAKGESLRYPTYEFANQMNEVVERFRVSRPEFAQRLTFRPIPALISKAEVTTALERAFRPAPNGDPPLPAEAQARWEAEVAALSAARCAAMQSKSAESGQRSQLRSKPK